MKKAIFFLIVVFLFAMFPVKNSAQYSIELILIDGLAELDIGTIISANGINNNQRYVSVNITAPNGEQVTLENEVWWQKDLQTENRWVASATTRPITVISSPLTITNMDIGSVIQIESSDFDNSVIDELIALGKLTGIVTIEMRLKDSNGNVVGTTSGEIGLLNPAHTINIISPPPGTVWNEGNILTQWSTISGARSYRIRCNTKSPGQNNEEGLNSGEMLLDDVDVGTQVSINLWDYFSRGRVPAPGSELVLQVVAIVPSTSVDTEIMSDIVNFYLSAPQTQQGAEQSGRFVASMRDYVSNSNLTQEEQEILNEFLDLVESGQVSFQGVTDESGNIIPAREVQRIMTYITNNPDVIVSIRQL